MSSFALVRRVVRFALLPPWQAFLGFTALAALVLGVIDRVKARQGSPADRQRHLGARIVDAEARPSVPEVLSASQLGGATEFAHDEQIYQEPSGIWTIGGRRAHLTVVAPPERTSPLVLRVHSGAQANTATFRTNDWKQRVSRVAGIPQEITLPHHLVSLTIDTESGFLPWKLDPTSTDRRFLGIWIEAVPAP